MVLEKTLENLLRLQGDQTSQSKKEINPEYSLERLMVKLMLQCFGHLMQRANSLEKTLMLGKTEGRRRRGRHAMRWLDGIRLNGHEFEQTPGDSEGQGSLACCSPRGRREVDATGPRDANWGSRVWV